MIKKHQNQILMKYFFINIQFQSSIESYKKEIEKITILENEKNNLIEEKNNLQTLYDDMKIKCDNLQTQYDDLDKNNQNVLK